MSDDERAVFVHVEGLVQGVGYRVFVAEQATALGVHGWVINCDDGSVEAALHGSGGKLGELIVRLRGGPPAAKVGNVSVRSTDRAHAGTSPGGAHTF